MKKIKTIIKLQIAAGKATPAPPVGPALGQHGLNIINFVNKFNEATKDKGETVIPVEISAYEDRTFDFIMKEPPAAELIKKAVGIEKGAKTTGKERVGKITTTQIKEIAKQKMVDLNAIDEAAAEKIIAGTARSMGVEVG